MSSRLPETGDVLAGRFVLGDRLGSGAMGVVYRATQLNLQREVAIKLLLPGNAHPERARARFLREARVAAALHHPNAVEIYDVGEEDGVMFLAMELLHGSTLRAWVDVGRPLLPLARTIAIAYQVADVLALAHGIPLVHRDIKPENLFLEEAPGGEERVVVVDFGLAFIEDAGQKTGHNAGDTTRDLGRMTAEGVIAGTPAYLSPEQARGRAVGPASDIYSLGCVLYELLTTTVPFDGDGGEILSRHMFAPPEPPRSRRPDATIPALLEDLVLRMLHKRPDTRPTAAEVCEILQVLDPAAIARSGGARETGHFPTREARMISPPPVNPMGETLTDAPSPSEPALQVAVLGSRDPELEVALAANGMAVVWATPDMLAAGLPSAAGVVYAPGAAIAALAALATRGLPIVSDAQPGELDRLRDLIRAGVAEVVIRPVSPADLVQKLARAARKGKARRRST